MAVCRPLLVPLLLVLTVWTTCVLVLSSSTTRERARLAFDHRLNDIPVPPLKLPPIDDSRGTEVHNIVVESQLTVSDGARRMSSIYPECREKEGLVDILLKQDNDGHFQNPDLIRSTCRGLPSSQQIIDIYGTGPVVLGLETCAAYRRHMSQSPDKAPLPRVAGLYHSGTNALAKILEKNTRSEKKGNKTIVYEVPWGKHIPVKYRNINTFPVDHPDKPDDVLPIVIVRNPFDWMRSMCKEGYDALWIKTFQRECPHLLKPGSVSIKNKIFVKAHQTQFRYSDVYDSLADFYSEWHRGYLNATFPRLFIRYEDLLLYPEQLLKVISECSGAPITDEFVYYNTEARAFIKAPNPSAASRRNAPVTVSSTMFRALVKLGQRDAMYHTLQEENRAYALAALDKKVLQAFQYQHLDDPKVPAATVDVNGPRTGKDDWLERRQGMVNERHQRMQQQRQRATASTNPIKSIAGSLTHLGLLRRSANSMAGPPSRPDETTQEAWDAKLMDLVKRHEHRQQLRKQNEARLRLVQARQRSRVPPFSLPGRAMPGGASTANGTP